MIINRVEEKNKVVFCIGANYWKHVAVAIFSIVRYAESPEIIVFYEADNLLWRSKIMRFVGKSGCRIRFIAFDPQLVAGLKDCGYIGLTTYYRLYVPGLLGSTADKILYLDSDLVVRAPIIELFGTPLNGNILAARPWYSISDCKIVSKTLDRSEAIPYFNAGVMLIDANLWRARDIGGKAISFIRQSPDKITFADQCALNHVIGSAFVFLPPRWNVTEGYFDTASSAKIAHFNYADIVDARENPAIVHYNGPLKPWHLANRHPWKSAYVSVRQLVQILPYISDDVGEVLLRKIKSKTIGIFRRFRKIVKRLLMR